VVYDVTNRESFNATADWVRDIRAHRGDDQLVYLVANKVDEKHRTVSSEEGEAFAEDLGCLYMETSATSRDSVIDLFNDISHELVERQRLKEAGTEMIGARRVSAFRRHKSDTDVASKNEKPPMGHRMSCDWSMLFRCLNPLFG
jgi:Ras-related protein Rab-18